VAGAEHPQLVGDLYLSADRRPASGDDSKAIPLPVAKLMADTNPDRRRH
jgi:hypothetical protein